MQSDRVARPSGPFVPASAVGANALADQLLQAAVGAARVGVWELDPDSGTVRATDSVRAMYGLSADQALTLDAFSERIHPEDRARVLAKVEASFAGQSELYDIEHRLVWPDGSVRWAQVRGNVATDEMGRARLIGTMVDVTERKEAELQLVAQGQLLRQLIAHTPAAVAMFDKQMRFLAVSQRWVTDYQLEGVPLTGRSLYELFPRPPAQWKEVHKRVLAGAVERCDEDRFQRRDGSTEWLQWEAQPWRDAGGEIAGLIIFTLLITARKRTEAALRQAEEKFARVFWDAPVALSMTRVSDGLLLDLNHEHERMFGYMRPEAVGRTTLELGMWVEPEDRRRMARELKSRGGAPSVREVVLRTRDGALIPVIHSAHPFRHEDEHFMLSAFQDLSERKRSDAAIRASESRLRRVFATPVAGMAFLHSGGTISEANAECLRILGYSSAELARERVNLRKLVSAAHQAALSEALLASGDLASRPCEIDVVRRDGSVLPVMLGISSVDEQTGSQVAFLFDLSERRALQRQLLHAQRMEAVGRLAAGVAHDFNNVIAAITMGMDMLGESLPSEHAGHEDLRDMRRVADRAVRLVRQLLTFSRQQVLELRVLGVNELMLSLEAMLRRLLGEKITLHLELSDQLPRIKADRAQIEQMILNLVMNARDAMPDGGQLTIRSESVRLQSEQHFDVVLPPGDYVLLSVADTGMGMDAATKARLFEPFFTTKDPSKGTGLGLPTVYGIVHQSGGAIDVVSAPGHGATFTVYLARVDEPASASVAPPALELVGGAETILMVEADAGLRRTTRKLLVGLGYRVLESESPSAALQRAGVYVGAIDLLLTNLGADGKAGVELAQMLRAQRPKLRVLYTATEPNALLALESLGAGCGMIQKPFAATPLARKLRSLLDA
jgi:two-component system cell cycle sensor histidine kinase/response regulator CckA